MQARILIVEDDVLQQSVLKSVLEASGHEVDTSTDGMDAIRKIREGHYDLVLLDYRLPEMDGLATARLVEEFFGVVGRPRLIALTATPDTVINRELLGGRAFDGVIAKTIAFSEMLATIEHHLRHAPSHADRQAAEMTLLVKEWGDFDAGPERPRGAGKPRILVVEDDEMQRSVLSAALLAQGFEVDVAIDGLSAFRKIRQAGFDVALIDYELPEIDGLATAKMVGELYSEAGRPRLIALTAAPDRLQWRTNSAPAAFDAVLGKMEGLSAVLATVHAQLGRRFGMASMSC
ncbi:MAG: hypothetical protein NVSMB18_06580 [Acetobacteraceae bacterium]